MRTVNELNENELEELKETYFYQLLDSDPDVLGDIDFPSDVPDDVVKSHYEGISFVEEDFFCNINN